MTDWSVLIERHAPTGEDADFDDLIDGVGEMAVLMADYSPAASADERSWSIRVTLPGPSPLEAIDHARLLIFDYAGKAGLPLWPEVRVESLDVEYLDLELRKDVLPALVGTQEVTDMLNVSRQRLHELRSAGRFPEPIIQLASGPVWLRPAVEAFIETWERRPGRPAARTEYTARARRIVGGWEVRVDGVTAGVFRCQGDERPQDGWVKAQLARVLDRPAGSFDLQPVVYELEGLAPS